MGEFPAAAAEGAVRQRASGSTVVQAGRDATVEQHFHTSSPTRPRQLPLPVTGFVGRVAHLEALHRLAASGDSTVVISALCGTAGVGKTALAVHWAHQAGARFPDGQLHVDLRGYGPGEPLAPAEVLARFLRALGAAAVPVDVDERAALYRSLLADRRVLIVLDNARSTDQVVPLLPASPGCFVVVTSRDALPELRVRHGALGLDVDLLTLDESMTLLRDLVGERVAQRSGEALALVERCARLPLALRMVAEMAAARPRSSLRELAEELEEERAQDVHAVIAWSVGHLDERCAAAFSLLGLYPGRDFDRTTLAALAGDVPDKANHLIDGLLRVHLIEAISEHRFRMHDLLRGHARHLAGSIDPINAHVAFSRLFDHYLHAGARVARTLFGSGVLPPFDAPLPQALVGLDDPRSARTWLEDEYANLAAIAVEAERRGEHTREVGHLFHHIALFARVDGDPVTALRHFDRAADLLRPWPAHAVSRFALDRAEALLDAGLATRAEALLKALRPYLDRAGVAEADHLRALAALMRGEFQSVRRLARSAERTFRTTGDRRAVVAALVRLSASPGVKAAIREAIAVADELDAAGEPGSAEFARLVAARLQVGARQHREAESALAATDPSSVDLRTLHRLCRTELLLAEGHDQSAVEEARVGLRELATTRREVTEFRLLTEIHARWLGALASHLAFDTLDPWEVLQVTEQTRLAASRSSVKRTPPPALNDLLTEMRHLVRALSPGSRAGAGQSTLHARLERLRADAALLGWTGKSPDVVGPADLRHALGARVLVGFTVSRNELSALVIAADTATVVPLGPADVAAEAAARFRADLSALALDVAQREPVRSVLDASARKEARWLDDALIKPLGRLVGDHDLVILPAWALHTVPWGCLDSLSARSVVVAPSATLWAARRHPRDEGGVVVVAGPHASPDVAQLIRCHARAELFTGVGATGAAVLASMDGARLAHLAVDASDQHENTALSAIQLADRVVFAHEFAELARPPEIVVLDGPSVGAQWHHGSQHEFGLADGLLRAGVRTVVVAAGDVSVAAGAEAMRDLHTALAHGESPARAVAEVSARDPFHRPYLCIGFG